MRPQSWRLAQSPVLVLMAGVAILPACGVELKNHTPAEFPYKTSDVPPASGVLYSGSTPPELRQLIQAPAHRLLLEIRDRNVSDVQAFATLDGTERPMAHPATSASALWRYEHPPTCAPQYNYFFRVRYKVITNTENAFLGSSASPMTARVPGAGDVIWFEPGLPIHRSTDPGPAQIVFISGVDPVKTIVVQSLRMTPTLVYGITLTNVSPSNSFQLLDVPPAAAGPPPPPAQALWLTCGQTLRFRIQWNSQIGAVAQLTLHAAEPGTQFQMNQSAVLTGRQTPP